MKHFASLCIKILCFIIVSIYINSYLISLPVPIRMTNVNPVMEQIKTDLVKLKVPNNKIQKIAEATYAAHKSTGINPKLILALIKTESNFKEDALGPPNRTKIRYKGLLQTPTASWYTDVDILHGTRILEDKLKQSQNNLPLALALYKGGDNKVARKQANQVIQLYHQLLKPDKS